MNNESEQNNQAPQPTPAVPVTPVPVATGPTNGLAIAALIVGIVAFLSGWIPFWGFIVGVAAVVLGVIALKKPGGKGMAIAGLVTGGLGALTGLPEYRNGGLFLDSGVISLKDSADARKAHEVASPVVVEWRALTVALLDEVAALIRQRLSRSREELPLAKVLQGGSWAAGRRIAREKRVDGGPPLNIVSDGTVF